MKDLVSLPARKGEAVLVVVETPAGSRVKLKLDPDLGHVAPKPMRRTTRSLPRVIEPAAAAGRSLGI